MHTPRQLAAAPPRGYRDGAARAPDGAPGAKSPSKSLANSLRASLAAAFLLAALLSQAGCSRSHYRLRADAESYAVLSEKQSDPRWAVPRVDITPDPRGRHFDWTHLDEPPLPPDDPAAHAAMLRPHGMRGWKGWNKYPTVASLENPAWTLPFSAPRDAAAIDPPGDAPSSPAPSERPALPRPLDLPQAVELGLLHSREFQTQLEAVYLSALALTGERYRFAVRPLGFSGEPGGGVGAAHTAGNTALLVGPLHAGVSRYLPSGAQFVAEVANNTLWSFSRGEGFGTATSLGFHLTQPLFAGGDRCVALESLTQAERNTLYSLRAFARFRKDFYVSVAAGAPAAPLPGGGAGGDVSYLIEQQRGVSVGFFPLLLQLQRWRNAEEHAALLQTNIAHMTALVHAGRAFPLDVLQLETASALSRGQAEDRRRRFADDFDRFKLQLGLPPDWEAALDDGGLAAFRLRPPGQQALEDELAALARALAQPVASADALRGLADGLRRCADHADAIAADAEAALEFALLHEARRLCWLDDAEQAAWREHARDTRLRVARSRARLEILRDDVARWAAEVEGAPIDELPAPGDPDPAREAEPPALAAARRGLLAIRERCAEEARELGVTALLARAERVLLPPAPLSLEDVGRVAVEQRLDLMNRRAQVMDARRRLEVAAKRLHDVARLEAGGNISTPAAGGNLNPLAFNSSTARAQVGLSLVTPLDRKLARNEFRASQIEYQQARRDYLAAEDTVKLQVRSHWRAWNAQGRAFELRRLALRSAAREWEQALALADRPAKPGQEPGAPSEAVLRALNNIREAQDLLIETWVAHETARLCLYRDLELMQIDPCGHWVETAPVVPGEAPLPWDAGELKTPMLDPGPLEGAPRALEEIPPPQPARGPSGDR